MRISPIVVCATVISMLAVSNTSIFADDQTDDGKSMLTSLDREKNMDNDNAQLEANEALARRWFDEVINQRNLDAIADIYSPGYIYHGPEGLEMRGIEPVRKFAASILEASNDRKATVEQQVSEGDLVVTRFISRGHHTGTYRGMEPTGKLWTTEGIDISRIQNGKIVEDWEVIHNSGL